MKITCRAKSVQTFETLREAVQTRCAAITYVGYHVTTIPERRCHEHVLYVQGKNCIHYSTMYNALEPIFGKNVQISSRAGSPNDVVTESIGIWSEVGARRPQVIVLEDDLVAQANHIPITRLMNFTMCVIERYNWTSDSVRKMTEEKDMYKQALLDVCAKNGIENPLSDEVQGFIDLEEWER